jgi:hypothetical protein
MHIQQEIHKQIQHHVTQNLETLELSKMNLLPPTNMASISPKKTSRIIQKNDPSLEIILNVPSVSPS